MFVDWNCFFSAPEISPRETGSSLWCTACNSSHNRCSGAESVSYATTRFVHCVSPPYGGTTTPRRIDPIGGFGRNVTSVCQRLSMLGAPEDLLAGLPSAFSRL